MRNKRGSILEVSITDGRGFLTLTFFNQKWRAAELRPGVRGIFAGKVGEYRGVRQLAHPDYELFTEADAACRGRARGDAAARSCSVADRAGARVGGAADPDLPGDVDAGELAAGPGDGAGARHPARDARRPGSGCRADRPRAAAVRRGAAAGPSAGDGRRLAAAQDALRFQEAFVLQAALLRQRAERRAAAATVRRAGQVVGRARGVAAVHADARPADRRRRDRARPGERGPDEPAGAGRGRVGQDAGRVAGDARGRGLGWAVGVPRADRGARGAAPAVAGGESRARTWRRGCGRLC